MKKATATLKSTAPFGFGKYYSKDKNKGESDEDYEKRTWRERCHVDSKGFVFIPPLSFKKSLDEAAAYRGEKIKGKGAKTWTKKFVSGVIVQEGLGLQVRKNEVSNEWIMSSSNGIPGGGKRVPKCFPVVHEWEGDVEYHILEDEITEEKFTETLQSSGMFIGIGRWRPANGGLYGRFIVEKVKWEEVS